MYQTQLNRPPRVFGRVGLFLGAPGRAHSLGGVSPRAAKHESTTLELIPTINGNNLSRSVTWTDFVAGGRFSMPLSSKASVDVFGDAGEGGATLDYQFGNPGLSVRWLRELSSEAEAGFTGRLEIPHRSLRQQRDGIHGTIQGIPIGATYKFK